MHLWSPRSATVFHREQLVAPVTQMQWRQALGDSQARESKEEVMPMAKSAKTGNTNQPCSPDDKPTLIEWADLLEKFYAFALAVYVCFAPLVAFGALAFREGLFYCAHRVRRVYPDDRARDPGHRNGDRCSRRRKKIAPAACCRRLRREREHERAGRDLAGGRRFARRTFAAASARHECVKRRQRNGATRSRQPGCFQRDLRNHAELQLARRARASKYPPDTPAAPRGPPQHPSGTASRGGHYEFGGDV
jgi:hypothetical protein